VRVSVDERWLYGTYVCVAKNQHGHAERSFKLLQAGKLKMFKHFLTLFVGISVSSRALSRTGAVEISAHASRPPAPASPYLYVPLLLGTHPIFGLASLHFPLPLCLHAVVASA